MKVDKPPPAWYNIEKEREGTTIMTIKKISCTIMVTDFGKLIFPNSGMDTFFTLGEIGKLKKTTAQWILDHYDLVSLDRDIDGFNFVLFAWMGSVEYMVLPYSIAVILTNIVIYKCPPVTIKQKEKKA